MRGGLDDAFGGSDEMGFGPHPLLADFRRRA